MLRDAAGKVMAMPKGGARIRSGSPADPNAMRRSGADGQWETLPVDAKASQVPEWPLTEATGRELELWNDLWVRPQSVLWERNSQELEVALFCRRLAESEQHESKVALGTLVRQMMDSLLLTIPAMRAARVRIAGVETEKAPNVSVPKRTSAKNRLRVVRGDGDAA
jgi:hypothetical protein